MTAAVPPAGKVTLGVSIDAAGIVPPWGKAYSIIVLYCHVVYMYIVSYVAYFC